MQNVLFQDIYMQGHVCIVYKIDYNTNSRNVSDSGIHLIEATGYEYKVRNYRLYSSFTDSTNSILENAMVVRLKK